MRQVPKVTLQNKPSYAIIGDGRVATHMCRYFNFRKISYQQWSRKADPKQKLLQTTIENNDYIILLIADNAIVPFIKSQSIFLHKYLIHFSGSLVTDLAIAVHPLMTFTDELYALAEYEKIPFILETESIDSFEKLFPDLPNPSFKIARADKAYYHALCVLGQNFSTLLWQHYFSHMQKKLGLPLTATFPLFKKTVLNMLEKPTAIGSGPLTRNDFETLTNDLNALKDHKDFYSMIFENFITAYQQEKLNECILEKNEDLKENTKKNQYDHRL